jgi:hypothetical protein
MGATFFHFKRAAGSCRLPHIVITVPPATKLVGPAPWGGVTEPRMMQLHGLSRSEVICQEQKMTRAHA